MFHLKIKFKSLGASADSMSTYYDLLLAALKVPPQSNQGRHFWVASFVISKFPGSRLFAECERVVLRGKSPRPVAGGPTRFVGLRRLDAHTRVQSNSITFPRPFIKPDKSAA